MPASVSLSGLSWSTPDGTPLFTDVNLSFGPECSGIVGRNGTGKSTLLRLIAGDLQPASGQVRVTGSIIMMWQDAMERPDETVGDLLGVTDVLHLLDRAEAGVADAAELADADWTLPARMEPRSCVASFPSGRRLRWSRCQVASAAAPPLPH